MVFNSIFFFLTLGVFLLLYYITYRTQYVFAKVLTLLYSLFFYGMWNIWFLALMIVTILTDYLAAIAMEKWESRKKLFLLISLVLNFGVLGFFKYFNFLSENAASIVNMLGYSWSPGVLKVVLPVGISFYTFQTLSYTIDVYRGDLKARRSWLDVYLFITYFPQLVAGPIVRAADFLPQIENRPKVTPLSVSYGLTLILAGLFQKCIVADNVAPRVNELFAAWQSNTPLQDWIAAALFGVQIYGDFSGYSMIAIGMASIMGFHLMRNFNSPYAALGFSDFWRRWHISLSTWLRDYLYIPLGGNRRGTGRTYINLMATMLLGGLWHGASFMFVVWGGLHGAYLCVEKLMRERLNFKPVNAWLAYGLSFVGIVLTYLTVTITWIPFRAENARQCLGMMKNLFSMNFSTQGIVWTDYTMILAVFVISCLGRNGDFLDRIQSRPLLKGSFAAAILISLYFLTGERSAFIYFQF